MIRVFQGHYSPLNTNIGAFDARSLSSNVSGVNNGAVRANYMARKGWGGAIKKGGLFINCMTLKMGEIICPIVNTCLRIL